jgi:hypothetical protein
MRYQLLAFFSICLLPKEDSSTMPGLIPTLAWPWQLLTCFVLGNYQLELDNADQERQMRCSFILR